MKHAGVVLGTLGAFLLLTGAALAQGTDSSSSSSQSGAGSQVREEEAQQKGQAAHVGAGTTDSTTTGHSGPSQPSPKPPGEVNVPPLPTSSLCDSYKDTPAYWGCVQIVLRQENSPQ